MRRYILKYSDKAGHPLFPCFPAGEEGALSRRERGKGNRFMGKGKSWIAKYKKVWIPVLILVILLALGIGLFFCLRPRPQEVQAGQETPGSAEESGTPAQGAAEGSAGQPDESRTQGGGSASSTAPGQGESSAAAGNAGGDSSTAASGNSSSTAGGSSTVGGSGSGTAAHTHSWANHTAVRQVWVSKMVTVDDYETKTIYGAQFYTVQPDGTMLSNGPVYWIENGFTMDDLKELIKNALKNSPGKDGIINGVYYGNYVNRTKTERVKVGSHQEDQGHYENQTYVDYQYCTVCGARKTG